jgi:hypothetical protein
MNVFKIINKRFKKRKVVQETQLSAQIYEEPVSNITTLSKEWVSKNDEYLKDYCFDSDNSSLYTVELN